MKALKARKRSLQSHTASIPPLARNSRGKGGDPADRWIRPCTLVPLHSLASEMPLTGVQYREKFVEETIHRIVYQCTRDELRLWSYIMYRGMISRFMDREYKVDRKNRFLMAAAENAV